MARQSLRSLLLGCEEVQALSVNQLCNMLYDCGQRTDVPTIVTKSMEAREARAALNKVLKELRDEIATAAEAEDPRLRLLELLEATAERFVNNPDERFGSELAGLMSEVAGIYSLGEEFASRTYAVTELLAAWSERRLSLNGSLIEMINWLVKDVRASM